MNVQQLIWFIIPFVAIVGGLIISVFVLRLILPAQYKERLILIENLNKERMALIEKGMDPNLAERKKTSGGDSLFWGLLLTGIGLGVFVGYIISHNNGWREEIVVNAMAMLLGGIGLITYYIYRKGKDDKKAI